MSGDGDRERNTSGDGDRERNTSGDGDRERNAMGDEERGRGGSSGRGPAIETEALSKFYGDTIAVEDLSLWIPRGQVYGFLGPNGAGKSTTMRMLATLTRPTSGTARICGDPITDRAAVVRHLGFLPEEPPLYDELTGREQLSYFAGLRDVPEARADERIEELLDRFDLTDAANRRIEGYSTGMRKKLGLAATLLDEPEVLLLDEPTSGLDPRAARTVRETIADLANADRTVFLSTHVLPVVDELADNVGVLFDGRLVAEGSPERLKQRVETGEERTLEDVFLEVTSSVDERDTSATVSSADPSTTDTR